MTVDWSSAAESEHPERRLGVFGIGLILCGFTLQSLQYWLSLFDVRLT
jgi:hypothetical protein